MRVLSRRVIALVLVTAMVNTFFPYAAFGGELEPDYKVYAPDYDRVSSLFSDSGTAIEVSQKGWPNGSDAVVIASDSDVAYAAMASPLAAALDSPVLVIDERPTPAMLAELERLTPERVLYVGRSGKSSRQAVDRLARAGWKSETLLGDTIYRTSYEVAKALHEIKADYRVVAVSTGSPQRLLLAAADAARTRSPLILFGGEGAAVRQEDIRRLTAKTALVIGPAEGTDTAAEQLRQLGLRVATIAGDDDVVAAKLYVAATEDQYGYSTPIVIGESERQSLAAPALAARLHGPLVLSDEKAGSEAGKDLLVEHCSSVDEMVVVGDFESVSWEGATALRRSASTIVAANYAIINPQMWGSTEIIRMTEGEIITTHPMLSEEGDQCGTPVDVGDYLVVRQCTQYPSGFYGKITLKEPYRPPFTSASGTRYVVTQVSLGELFKNASYDLEDEPVEMQNARDYGGKFTQSLKLKFNTPIPSEKVGDSGSKASVAPFISGAAEASAKLKVHFCFDEDGGLKSYKWTVTNELSAELTMGMSGEFKLKPNPVHWKSFRGKPIVITVGVIPVVLVPTFDVNQPYASGSVKGDATVTDKWSKKMVRGTEYHKGQDPVNICSDTEPDTSTMKVEAKFTGDVKIVFIEMKASLKLYGLAGPSLTISVSIKGEVIVTYEFAPVQQAKCELKLSLGLSVTVSFTIEWFKRAELDFGELKFDVLKIPLGGHTWVIVGAEPPEVEGLNRLRSKAKISNYGVGLSGDGSCVAYRVGGAVYVTDFASGKSECVSVDAAGRTFGGMDPSLSSNGLMVAFVDGTGRVWVRDRKRKTTRRVDVSTKGVPADGSAGAAGPMISGDGTKVLFASDATNLISPAPSAYTTQLYVHDLSSRTTRCVSRTSRFGTPAGVMTDCDYPELRTFAVISRNGRYVLWVPQYGAFGKRYVVLCTDLVTGDSRAASTNSKGMLLTMADATVSSISDDGNAVAFYMSASGSAVYNLWAKNMTTGVLEMVNYDNCGRRTDVFASPGVRTNPSQAMSADGRYVVFAKPGGRSVFRRDLRKNVTRLMSGRIGPGYTVYWDTVPAVSSDGRLAAFVAFNKDAAVNDVGRFALYLWCLRPVQLADACKR